MVASQLENAILTMRVLVRIFSGTWKKKVHIITIERTQVDAVLNGVAVIGLDELLITSFRMQLS